MSMIGVDYNVLNQRGSPSWFSDIYANIPTAGYKGRMFISTDTFAFYRDTGTGWDLIGGPGTGTITGSGTSGQVSYFNGSSTLAGSNNLFWDITNNRLGIGTATPGVALDIHATGTNAQFNGTGTNNAYLVFQNAGTSKWRIGNTYNAGANSFDIYNNGLTTNAISIQSSSNDITLTGNLNNGVKVITTGGIVCDTAILLKNLGSVTGTNGYSSFSGNAANNGFTFAPNNSSYHRFITPTSANYDYTFPASSGTIALTSDLTTGYVPYTGATTNLNLGFYNLITGQYININGPNGLQGGFLSFKQFSSGATIGQSGYTSIYTSNINLLGFNFYQSGSTFKNITFDCSSVTGGTTRNFIFPDATGTLALTSNLSSYLPLTGGTLTGQLYINPTNTGTVGLDVASDTIRFRSDNLEGFKRQLNITMGSGTLIQFTASGFGGTYGTDLAFYTSSASGVNGNPAMYITGGNKIGLGTGSPQSTFVVGVSADTQSCEIDNGTSGVPRIFAFNRNGGFSLPLAIQSVGGNVLIGTTTDAGYKLYVNGQSKLNSILTDTGNIGTCNSGTFYTGFTISSLGMYLVWSRLPAGVGDINYTANCIVISDGSAARITNLTGVSCSIQLSGLNVQFNQSSGAQQSSLIWYYQKIAL